MKDKGSDSPEFSRHTPMMQQHMLGNMRDHLLALTEIQEALAAGAFDRAADIAETRIGMSSLDSHGASHMAPHMPQGMRDIGTPLISSWLQTVQMRLIGSTGPNRRVICPSGEE